jgi:hypothetical protein
VNVGSRKQEKSNFERKKKKKGKKPLKFSLGHVP